MPYFILAFALLWCLPVVAEEDLLTVDELDLLADDELSLSPPSAPSEPRQWWDDLRTTLEQSHSESDAGTLLQRGSARLEFERGFAKGWYGRIDARLRHFWSNDRQARQRDGAYTHSQIQQLWLQYSQGPCAHKLGRQTLVWGEVEGVFVADVITPFDYTEPLLTDYSNLRRAQTMLLSECYFADWQGQLFYTPEAELDRFTHGDIGYSIDTGAEWGGRLKYSWQGGDLSLYAAHLFDNTPSPILVDGNEQAAVAEFDLLGLSATLARGSLLAKLDLAYKPQQLVADSAETSDTLEVASGVEYITSNNHNLNAGVWWTQRLDEVEQATAQSPLFTLGWNKSYLNDNLAMSLLAYAAREPRLAAINLLAEYKWSDYWTIATALGVADFDEETAAGPFGLAKRSLMSTLRFTF